MRCETCRTFESHKIITSIAERCDLDFVGADVRPAFTIEYVNASPLPSIGGSIPSPTVGARGDAEWVAKGALGAAAGAAANGLAPANGFSAAAGAAAKGFAAAANGLCAPTAGELEAGGGAMTPPSMVATVDGSPGAVACAIAAAISAFSSTIRVDPIWIWSPGRTLHLLTRCPFTRVPGSFPKSISVMSEGEATSITACMREASSSSTRK